MLEVFIRNEVPETVAEVHADLVELLAAVETDAEAEELIVRLRSSYQPAMKGKSSPAWLQSISTRLERAISPCNGERPVQQRSTATGPLTDAPQRRMLT